jgi:hypothetical protein
MTKQEAIEFIEHCSEYNEGPFGFFVCGISGEDIEIRCDEEEQEAFNQLSDKDKEKALSFMADALNEQYQEYTFGCDFDAIEKDFESMID